jgi:hypothetical protein
MRDLPPGCTNRMLADATEEYDYDPADVEEWWFGTEEFYENVGIAFGEQVEDFFNATDRMPEQVRNAVAVFLDWYKVEHYHFIEERYHEYRLAERDAI